MAEFIFMLTHHDATVPDALEVYESLRATGLRHVGFKDIGLPPETLAGWPGGCTRTAARSTSRSSASAPRTRSRSITVARDIGVDVVMGGTHPDAAIPLLAGTGIRYFPFPGRIVGHPSVLEGTADEIAESAAGLSARPGVDGLDLLAYRHAGDVPSIIRAVVAASAGPVVVAGSIDSAERIATVTELGAWGFTIGGAIFEQRAAGRPERQGAGRMGPRLPRRRERVRRWHAGRRTAHDRTLPRPRVIRLAEAESFMEGDEHCRHYVSTGKITFGTSSLQPGQRGAVDTGHPASHEVFFVVRGHVLIHTEGREHFELRAGDAIVIPEGVPHTLINVGRRAGPGELERRARRPEPPTRGTGAAAWT